MRSEKDLSRDQFLLAMRVFIDRCFRPPTDGRDSIQGRGGVGPLARRPYRHFHALTFDRGGADPRYSFSLYISDPAVADGNRDIFDGRRRYLEDRLCPDVRIELQDEVASGKQERRTER